ncbi:MAG: GNAT family N-acetyltransferase [Lachnospirales bacterium]
MKTSIKWLMGYDNLAEVHEIRRKVFINEQGVKEELELDGSDSDAIHLLLFYNTMPIGTGRLIMINGDYTLGRIAVIKEYRGKGYGRIIIENLIKKAISIGSREQYIHAQITAKAFYEKLGFKPQGNEYSEAGIRHITMCHKNY